MPDGLPSRGAQGEADLAISVRDRPEGLPGRGDDDGQGHDPEGQSSGDDGNAELQENDEQAQAEKAENNRRHSGQVDDRQVDDPGQKIVLGVFGEVDGGHHPDRQGEGQGDEHEVDGSDDRREDPPGPHPVSGHREQKFPGQRSPPLGDDQGDDGGDGDDDEQGGQQQDAEADFLAAELASHFFRPRLRRRSAVRLMAKEMMNRTMPTANRAK